MTELRPQEARALDVLVVDDEATLRALIAGALRSAGHEVRTADDGREALHAVVARRPDVVVLDVVMPRLDGWGLLEALAEDPSTAQLPVVMLTALAGEEDVIRAHLTGAVSYLIKPFASADLVAAVRRAATPPTDAQRRERRAELRAFLGRLAELDAGRTADGPQVRFSGLEALPTPTTPTVPTADVEVLTPRQALVAGLLADGVPARDIATRLGTSRSNVYATRSRVARALGVPADAVADAARRAGLTVGAELTVGAGAEDVAS